MKEEALRRVMAQVDTPCYVFDTDEARGRMEQVRQLLGDAAEVCFAVKANPFLMGVLADMVDRFEICSPGEYHIFEELGLSGSKLVYSGVYKDEETLIPALDRYGGEGIFTVESDRQLMLMEQWGMRREKQVCAYLRLTSGNQFGMDGELLKKLVEERARYPHVAIAGLHYFSGTQKKKLAKIEKELANLDSFVKEVREQTGFSFADLEYGPGLSVRYFEGEAEEAGFEERLRRVRELLGAMEFSGRVRLEMGRFFAADCGWYVTEIREKKKNRGTAYLIADGGIHQLNYDGQLKGMYVPSVALLKRDGTLAACAGEETYTVCGSLCTGNDILIGQLKAQEIAEGDRLLFGRAGAYSFYEGMTNFLSRDYPTVYFYSEDGGLKKVREPLASYKMNFAAGAVDCR